MKIIAVNISKEPCSLEYAQRLQSLLTIGNPVDGQKIIFTVRHAIIQGRTVW
jgi:hypothetical protein